MSGYETLLLLHVLGAFFVVAGLAVSTPLAFGADLGPAKDSVTKIGAALFGIGGLLTLAFGFWLVADRDLELLEGWIVGGIVLWLFVAATGNRIKGPESKAMYWLAVAGTFAVVALMIFKPGA